MGSSAAHSTRPARALRSCAHVGQATDRQKARLDLGAAVEWDDEADAGCLSIALHYGCVREERVTLYISPRECGAQPSAAATGHSVLRHRRRRPVAVVAARAGVRCTSTGAPSAPWPASAWPEASFGAAEAARKMTLFFRLAARPESRFGFRLSAFGKGRRLSPDKGGFRFSVFRKRRTALRESTKRGRGERCRDMRGFCYGLLPPTKLRGSYPETIPDVCDES